ncbi:hypothetical protein E3N88_12366 [Mikania micrantha]|uniref:CCHC-type domain-containing protein n=1 Tax=Mikania micrantha TaxID=192012 RepID=A0A5N6P6L7_9ASTR|nr:hypothetical protein E3N88_12366 [Mikania micrantha]
MAEDGKVAIEKFNGSDFGWWKMQVEALLCQKDLDVALGDKPEKMDQETTASGMMNALSNMYEKPSAANKVFLIRELVNTKMMEGASALLLLSLLSDSWSGTVTAVTSSVGASGMTFEGIRDLVLGEDIRRKNQGGSSSSEMLHVGRGRRDSRDSGSRGRSSSRTKKSVKCWNCNEVGHVKSQCPKKQLNAATEDVFEDDALILSDESSVDSWVMDYGASIHATHSSELMKNLKIGDFGKICPLLPYNAAERTPRTAPEYSAKIALKLLIRLKIYAKDLTKKIIDDGTTQLKIKSTTEAPVRDKYLYMEYTDHILKKFPMTWIICKGRPDGIASMQDFISETKLNLVSNNTTPHLGLRSPLATVGLGLLGETFGPHHYETV